MKPPSTPVVVGVSMMLLGLVLIAIAFAEGPREEKVAAVAPQAVVAPGVAPGTTAPMGVGQDLGEGTAPLVVGRSPLPGFGEVQVVIETVQGDLCEACLLSATTEEQRARGLMEVDDPSLGGYDGMLFEYPAETTGGFWMRNTPLALSIAYFDASGTVVSVDEMTPCEDSPDCPTYPAAAPFMYALEVPTGQLAELGVQVGSTLRITGRSCPLADYDR